MISRQDTWGGNNSDPLDYSDCDSGAVFGIDDKHHPRVVFVWAGDDCDPVYMTPAAARRAAVEWPVILLSLADEAEAAEVRP